MGLYVMKVCILVLPFKVIERQVFFFLGNIMSISHKMNKMLATLRAWKERKDGKANIDAQKSINVHEEYHKTLRTKSYADFFTKAQFLVNQPSFYTHYKFSEILLEPGQESIPSIVDSAILSKTPELRNLMLSYFDITAEASTICSHLLKSITQVQSNHEFIQRALDIIDDDSAENFELIIFELNSFFFSKNPLSNLYKNGFKLINDKNSSMLHHLRSMRKRVIRKMKLIKYMNKTFGICFTAACGLVVIAATVIAAHTLTALVMGPAVLLSFPVKRVKRKLQGLRFGGSGLLGKVRDQLDVAAKGTYILNRDFDTISRLVARVHDEIEHNKTMIQFFMERKEDYKFSFQLVKEIRKSDVGFRKQVEELEEQVYLCLMTINRARALVIKEMKKYV